MRVRLPAQGEIETDKVRTKPDRLLMTGVRSS